jgi:hypothetical protein
MSAFPQLSNADIDNIIAYTSEPKVEAARSCGWRFLDLLLIMALNNIILGSSNVMLVVMLF